MMHTMIEFVLAHGPAAAAFMLVVIPALITGLTPYPKAAGFVDVLRIMLNFISILTHHDSPGTFKLPLTFSKPPDSTGKVVDLDPHGFVSLWVLLVISAVSLLALPAMAQTPPVPAAAPTRTFGGCNNRGTFCAGPSGLINLTGYNLTTHEVISGFSPGLGYGFTIHPKEWYAFGLDAFVSLQVGTKDVPQRVEYSLITKFANYLRVGIGRDRIGEKASWIVPVGLGIDFP